MSTDTQKPSEHAVKAAKEWCGNIHEKHIPWLDELATVIDQHAIAPAVAEATAKLEQELNTAHAVGSSYAKELAEARREVAERDKRIAELEEALQAIAGTTMSQVASMEHGFYRCTGIAAAVLKPKKGQP